MMLTPINIPVADSSPFFPVPSGLTDNPDENNGSCLLYEVHVATDSSALSADQTDLMVPFTCHSSMSSSPTDVLENDVLVLHEPISSQVTRKRKRNEENWKQNKRKHLLHNGNAYISTTGKPKPAKEFVGLGNSCCKHQCTQKLSDEESRAIFSRFWQLGEYDAQNMFIAGSVRQNNVAVHRIPTPHNNGTSKAKEFSRKYHVQVSDRDVIVCKPVYLKLLGVSAGRINNVLANQRANDGVAATDKRGKHCHAYKSIPLEARQSDHFL